MAGSERFEPRMPLLFFADGYRFPDVFHTTKLLTPDPIIALEDVEELVIVASSLEEGRARKESRATKVHNTNEFGAAELASKGVTGTELNATIMKRFLDDRALTRVAVPPYFPVAEADRLREMGVTLVVAKDLRERRRAKRPDEIAAIVMDIFPQHKTTRYWADMTRTVSKGEPPAEIRKMYEVVMRAQDAGIRALRPGVTGREVNAIVEDIIWSAGYDTLRPGQKKD